MPRVVVHHDPGGQRVVRHGTPHRYARGSQLRIAIVANDTRGGIQPYIALGLGLRRAGHEVRGVLPSDFVLNKVPLAGGNPIEVKVDEKFVYIAGTGVLSNNGKLLRVPK